MLKIVRHVLLPGIMPLLFLVIAATPVDTLGCRNRGLLALAISFISGIAALVTVIKALIIQRSGVESAIWWIFSTLILSVPVIAMIVLA